MMPARERQTRKTVGRFIVPEKNPRFFPTAEHFRAWLIKHHLTKPELLVGYYKVKSGRPSMTWADSVAQALCFGWIDGIRRSVDEISYSIRFTPRRPASIWSEVNLATYERMQSAGLVLPAGEQAFARRRADRTGVYGYENRPKALSKEFEQTFRAQKRAWKFFSEQAPSYQKIMFHWVMSAKREATRERRLARLIDDSSRGRRVS